MNRIFTYFCIKSSIGTQLKKCFKPPVVYSDRSKAVVPVLVLLLVLFVRLFDLCLFGFIGFLFLLVSGKGCGL